MRIKNIGVLLFCSIFSLALATPTYASVSADELYRQKSRALEYQLQLARMPGENATQRERLYLLLLDECPATEAAEEAYWALANLYLDDFDEPKEGEARDVLERFIQKYPNSRWLPQVESRLLWLYEGTGEHARTAALFERVLTRDMPLSTRLPLELRCAGVYETVKQLDKARELYRRIVKEAGNGAFPEAKTAKVRLEALGKN